MPRKREPKSKAEFRRAALKAAEAHPAPKRRGFEQFLIEEMSSDRGPYSFEGHEALRQIAGDHSRVVERGIPDVRIDVLKGEQIGMTTLAVCFAVWGAVERGLSTAYFLPTTTATRTFDQTKVARPIRRSRYVRERMRMEDDGPKGTDRIGLREFFGDDGDSRYFYTVGLKADVNAVMISIDCALDDEVNLIPEENLEWSEGRMAHSPLKLRLGLSAGRSPGEGIDARFQRGCQYHRHLRCPACRADFIPEDEFPECVHGAEGNYWLGCVKCGRELDPDAHGLWVPHYPGRREEGLISYRLSQLAVPAMSLKTIMERHARAQRKASQLAKFNCAVLARPDAGSLEPITEDVLDRATGSHVMARLP